MAVVAVVAVEKVEVNMADIEPVQTAVLAVDTALNSIPLTSPTTVTETIVLVPQKGLGPSAIPAVTKTITTIIPDPPSAYHNIMDRVNLEVWLLGRAGAVFGAGTQNILINFSQRVGQLSSKDVLGMGSDTFFANIITHDTAGDAIRTAVCEYNNIQNTSSSTTVSNNDPAPQQAYAMASSMGISITDYYSQNK